MGGLIILGISVVFALFFVMNPVFADTVVTSEQTTLSGDLQNNPVAQDILKKIEKSKRWIAQMEQRNFEESERQKELEQKRVEVLQSLEKDLKKWETEDVTTSAPDANSVVTAEIPRNEDCGFLRLAVVEE